MRRGRLGQRDERNLTGGENDLSAEGGEAFKGLTLTGQSRRAGPNGSPYKSSFSPSSSKQAQRARPEPHGLNPSRHNFLDQKPKRMGVLIVVEINTPKTHVFNYTGILNSGMN